MSAETTPKEFLAMCKNFTVEAAAFTVATDRMRAALLNLSTAAIRDLNERDKRAIANAINELVPWMKELRPT